MTDCVLLMRPEAFEGLPYRIYVPENLDPAKRYPLVLFLHGMGECGGDNCLHVSKNSVMETLLAPENLAGKTTGTAGNGICELIMGAVNGSIEISHDTEGGHSLKKSQG